MGARVLGGNRRGICVGHDGGVGSNRAGGKIIDEGSLVELTQAVERCLLADLPRALNRLLATLADKAALDADVVHLMDACRRWPEPSATATYDRPTPGRYAR